MNAEHVLRRQLEALERGRARLNAQRQREARDLRVLVFELAAADMQAGKPPRGRAGRVQRKLLRLGKPVGERLVRKILSAIQRSVADPVALTSGQGEQNQ